MIIKLGNWEFRIGGKKIEVKGDKVTVDGVTIDIPKQEPEPLKDYVKTTMDNIDVNIGNNRVIVNGQVVGGKNKYNLVIISENDLREVKADGSVAVEKGSVVDLSAGGSVTVGGHVAGDIQAGGSVTVGGEVTGDIQAGGSVRTGRGKI